MAFDDNYAGAAGATIYCGMAAPPPTGDDPAWMSAAGVALNKLVIIPGSSGAAGEAGVAQCGVYAFSGVVAKHSTCELLIPATGGHSDSSDNGVYGINLKDDSPRLAVRTPPTPVGIRVPDVDYQPDGKPTSRHTYSHAHYLASIDRVMLIGGQGQWVNAHTIPCTTGWCPSTNQWDPAPTYVYNNTYNNGVCADDINNVVWTVTATAFNPATNTYSKTGCNQTVPARMPYAMDTNRMLLFCLNFGNGITTPIGQPLNASKTTNLTGSGAPVQTRITFNDSPGYQQLMLDSQTTGALIPGMVYDSINDVFYWYNGLAGQENNLYVIHPNSTNVWDITLFPFAAGSPTMTTQAPSGLNGRIAYFPLLKGIVIWPLGGQLNWTTQPMYFLKTSI